MTASTKKGGGDFFVILQSGKEHYTVQEAAEILHVSIASVQSYITNKIIHAELINGRRMVSRDALSLRLSQLGKFCIYGFAFDEVNN